MQYYLLEQLGTYSLKIGVIVILLLYGLK